MATGRAFISYRREDASAEARSIYQRLERTFGKERLFIDVDSIPKGGDFKAELERSLATCALLVAVIGPRWLDVRDAAGGRRIDDASDFVRLEISRALARGIRVVPVLVSGAALPGADALPADILPLSDRQAMSVRHESFGTDMAGLEQVLRTELGAWYPPPSALRFALGSGAVAAAALLPAKVSVPIVATLVLVAAGYFLRIPRGLWEPGTAGSGTPAAETRGAPQPSTAASLAVIRDELEKNIGALSAAIGAIAGAPPQPFWDKRRPNESEPAYQDRASAHFRDYQADMARRLLLFPLSTAVFESMRRDLAPEPPLAARVRAAYDRLNAARVACAGYEEGLGHLLELSKLGLSDTERATRAENLRQEKIAQARAELLGASAEFCLLAEHDYEVDVVSQHLTQAGINIDLTRGAEGFRLATETAAGSHAQRTAALAERVTGNQAALRREIERRVSDPYLLMLRKAAGLSQELSSGELRALERKALERDTTSPAKLVELAAFAFLECDGRAAATYYERALASAELDDLQRRFVAASLHRLRSPDAYDGALGVFVMSMTDGNALAAAGLLPGDVIVRIDGGLVNEPLDVATTLAQAESAEVSLIALRNSTRTEAVVKTRHPAGARLSSLIMLNAMQM